MGPSASSSTAESVSAVGEYGNIPGKVQGIRAGTAAADDDDREDAVDVQGAAEDDDDDNADDAAAGTGLEETAVIHGYIGGASSGDLPISSEEKGLLCKPPSPRTIASEDDDWPVPLETSSPKKVDLASSSNC